MKQHHRPRLIMRVGGFQTESVKNHTDYRKVSRFEQKQGLVHSWSVYKMRASESCELCSLLKNH